MTAETAQETAARMIAEVEALAARLGTTGWVDLMVPVEVAEAAKALGGRHMFTALTGCPVVRVVRGGVELRLHGSREKERAELRAFADAKQARDARVLR